MFALRGKVTVILPSRGGFEIELLKLVQDETLIDGLIETVSSPIPVKTTKLKVYRVAKHSRSVHALVNAGFAANVIGDTRRNREPGSRRSRRKGLCSMC